MFHKTFTFLALLAILLTVPVVISASDLTTNRLNGGTWCHDEYADLPVIFGTEGDDPQLEGSSASERICGLAGHDTINALDGDDVVNGNMGNDVVNGNIGDDQVHGGQNDDTVRGGKDNDTVYGDKGNDTLYGDLGNDTLFGGEDNDTFYYRLGDGDDIISDCEGDNKLILTQIVESLVSYEQQGNDRLVRINTPTEPGSIKIVDYHNGCNLAIEFQKRPNVVVIFADDLGYGDLGVYGQEKINTPRLDQMAAEGMRLTNFYSGAPHCPPARSTLMTGQHTGHTYIRHEGVLASDSPATPKYLPRFLQNADYVTGMFGKWGLGDYPLRENGGGDFGEPINMGFDEFLGQLKHRDAHTYTLPPYKADLIDPPIHPKLWTIENGQTVEYAKENILFTHDEFVNHALDFIERQQGHPFFLYLPFTIPHAELYVPDDKSDKSLQKIKSQYFNSNGSSKFPEMGWEGDSFFARDNDYPRATYAAMISILDRDVGRILDRLEALGLDENTVVFFTSDNGPHKAGGMEPTFFESAGGLRGIKWSLYEGGIRVPMIARWPGTIPAGQTNDDPMALWDLLPTITDMTDVEATGNVDGMSMFPLLKGESQPQHDYLYWETFTKDENEDEDEDQSPPRLPGQAVRKGKWKAVREGIDSPNDTVRLYDLENDEGEQINVADLPQNCPVLQELKTIMNTARTPPDYNPDNQNFEIVPLTIESCSKSSVNALYLPIVIGSPSQGNTGITVTNTNDAGPGSLRQAVADAQAGNRIGFDVTGTIILQSQITIDKNLSIVGQGTDQIVISGNNATRVFEVLPGKRVTISGVSIVNGNAEYGGGIYNSGDLTVADSLISQNTATVHGGGVYNFGNSNTRSVFTVNNSTISKNTAPNGSGGGIHNCCAEFDSGYTTLTIEKSLIYSNTVGYSGGGIFVGNYTTFHLSESTIEKNTNMVADGWGGGLYISQLGSHTISGSTISQNRTFGRGGGLHTAGNLTLVNSTVTQNLSAMQGGGISLRATTVEVINSTISENTTQDSGGGIFSHGTLKPKGTIIANNESTDTARIDIDYFGGRVLSEGYNLVGVTAGCCGGFTEWLSSDKVGADTNPMLNRLADNGGPTDTMALQPASPAIDAIPTDNCTDIQGNPLTTDQRGTSRQGEACDIGAYEYP